MRRVTLVSFAMTCIAIVNSGFISGPNCGRQTPITRIKTLPEDPEEIESLGCVIVEDDKALAKYRSEKAEKEKQKTCELFDK